ncbi:SulP family inorganic anion transporter [Mycolicibacterium sp. CBM1]
MTSDSTGAQTETDTGSQGALATILRYDVPASLVVFLVALPLSLGIAIASNAPVLAGLIAAIVGGLVAGALGGSPLQVSGPAAGLTVIVAGLVAEFSWAVTCAITVCAGALQIVFGLSRCGRAALAISPMVVHAMLAGIGITIALQQVHVLLGGSSESSAWRNITELPMQLFTADHTGMFIGLLVIAILVAWRWVPLPVRRVPGPLVAIVVASLVAWVAAPGVPRIALDGSLIDALALPGLPDGNWGAFATGVVTVALIASVESLLTAVAVDRMHTGSRSNLDRELVGQGAANMVSGVVGGLPITGVIVRSTANVAAGAKTRASTMLHALWVLVFALPFAGLATQIPTAALAGLLIVVGIQLVKITHIETARRTGDIAVYLVTLGGVVFLNLLEGVLLGLALAVALTVWRVARARIHAEPVDNGQWLVTVEGSCTFLSLPRMHRVLAAVPQGARVILELSVDFIDHAAQQTIEDWRRQHEAAGGIVLLREVGAVELDSALTGPPARAFSAVDPTPENARTLLITCTDCGVEPTAISTGELVTFGIGDSDSSLDAAIAYAVGHLNVTMIVVCGHSGCPTMAQLRDDRAEPSATLAAFDDGRHPVARSAAAQGFEPTDQLCMVDVAVKAQAVAAHPLVHEGMKSAQMKVVGLFHDRASACVFPVECSALEPNPTGREGQYGFGMSRVTMQRNGISLEL